MIGITVDVGNLNAATRRLRDLTNLGIQRKLNAYFRAFLDSAATNAPVDTGLFLASFQFVQSLGEAREVEAPGPSAWGYGDDTAGTTIEKDNTVASQNRLAAYATALGNFNPSITRNPLEKRTFYVVNTAEDADIVEALHAPGLMAIAHSAGLQAARVTATINFGG